jgi:hypothetical protein
MAAVSIVDLWRRQGGTPVPNLSSPPLEVEASQPRAEVYDQGEDDYDDDQQGDENDVDIKPEQQSEPIVPTYVPMTFRDHPLYQNVSTRLMDSTIAHGRMTNLASIPEKLKCNYEYEPSLPLPSSSGR